MRLRTFIFAVVSAAMLGTTPASAGWEATEWGMSPEAVEAAMPDTQHIARGATLDGKRAMSRGPYLLGEARRQALYYYDANGLAMVSIEVPPGECRSALDVLVQRYGNPLRVSDQAILRLVIWHDEAAATRVRAMISTSVCSVYFERLADYRDVDLANAGRR